jgi:hypothetical protein
VYDRRLCGAERVARDGLGACWGRGQTDWEGEELGVEVSCVFQVSRPGRSGVERRGAACTRAGPSEPSLSDGVPWDSEARALLHSME